VQLDAYKLTGGQTATTLFQEQVGNDKTALPHAKKKKLPTNTYDRQMLYANEKGFKTPADAISKMGKNVFLEDFEVWCSLPIHS
jgi:hypothetical protein